MHANNSHPVQAQSGAASFTSAWLAVGAAGMRDASFTVAWSAVAATDGAITFEGSDDPDGNTYVLLTIDKQHGDDIAAVGASAGKAIVILSTCPGWVRLRYTRNAGGGANQFDAYVTILE